MTMIDLRKVRNAAGLSQASLAVELGLSQSGQRTVSQIESRSDWLLSSVAAYIRAAGGTAELLVKVGSEEISFRLA